jgi:hypothetical protein
MNLIVALDELSKARRFVADGERCVVRNASSSTGWIGKAMTRSMPSSSSKTSKKCRSSTMLAVIAWRIASWV